MLILLTLVIETVLVIEYGKIEYAPGVFDPPILVYGLAGITDLASHFQFQTLPIPEMNNRTASVLAGQVVGGSSAINGMFFDRGSRFDYDAWTKAGSPDFDSSENKWNWDGMFSYFKKVSSLKYIVRHQEANRIYRVLRSPRLHQLSKINTSIPGTCLPTAVLRQSFPVGRLSNGPTTIPSHELGKKWALHSQSNVLRGIRRASAGYQHRKTRPLLADLTLDLVITLKL
jgi:choline dehydrogenase-like flavoprotein